MNAKKLETIGGFVARGSPWLNAQIAFDDGELRAHRSHNGSGVYPEGQHDGFGLQGMRERVEGMGGQLAIRSTRGAGTAVCLVLPLPNPPPLG